MRCAASEGDGHGQRCAERDSKRVSAAASSSSAALPPARSSSPSASTAPPAPARAAGLPARLRRRSVPGSRSAPTTRSPLVGSSEMGQGAMTGLAQMLAEDLMVDWTKVRAEASPAGAAFANPALPLPIDRRQLEHPRLLPGAAPRRRHGARHVHRRRGADLGRVGERLPRQQRHRGEHRHQRRAHAMASSPRSPPPCRCRARRPLVPDSALRIIGKPMPRVDLPAKTDGSAIYGIDVRVPGMVYAVVKHCPQLGGQLVGTPARPSGAIAVVPLTVLAGTGAAASRRAWSTPSRWSPTTPGRR